MSSFEGLINLIHREVFRVLHRHTRRTPCIVDSYDPSTHSVKVKLMPDSIDEPVITGWIQVNTPQTGNKSGWHLPPNIGDHGWIEAHDWDREAFQYVGSQFNDQLPPVGTTQAGEWFYKQPNTGATIYYKNDGSVTLTDQAGSTVIMDGQGNLTVQGKSGNKVFLNENGQIAVVPEGTDLVYLGGDGKTGGYDFVTTSSGPSINVKARIS